MRCASCGQDDRARHGFKTRSCASSDIMGCLKDG
jgi:hypothetical protein